MSDCGVVVVLLVSDDGAVVSDPCVDEELEELDEPCCELLPRPRNSSLDR